MNRVLSINTLSQIRRQQTKASAIHAYITTELQECTEVNKINEEKIDNVLTANIYSICFEYYEIDEDYAHSIALLYSDLMECIDPSSGLQVKQRKPNFETISFSLYHTTPYHTRHRLLKNSSSRQFISDLQVRVRTKNALGHHTDTIKQAHQASTESNSK